MNPYSTLPPTAFWRSGVADLNPFEISDLWKPRFKMVQTHKFATFGSCFAQHIGRSLKERGFDWLNTEPSPARVSPHLAKSFNYDIFTCRTGNIYTASLLRQWTRWALGKAKAPDECWERNDRYFDPFRPAVEPGGFGSRDEMLLSRAATISAFRQAITESSVFVFTLGLTESWWNASCTVEYPTCPGTAAGSFDPDQHLFFNQGFPFAQKSLLEAIDLMREANPEIRFLLTVSPVPLTATNSGRHVVVATMASKSILRAVVDFVCQKRRGIDYFPSYEIINSPVFRGAFFEANQRSVSGHGVNFVMQAFFTALDAGKSAGRSSSGEIISGQVNARSKGVVCEEELLQAFGPRPIAANV